MREKIRRNLMAKAIAVFAILLCSIYVLPDSTNASAAKYSTGFDRKKR